MTLYTSRVLIRELDQEKTTGGETPAEHRSVEGQIADSKTTLLEVRMKKKFRPCVMRAAYLAQDDPPIAESATEADVSQLKRVGKYIVKHPMTSNEFVDQSMFEQIRVHVDTDHAGMCTHKTQYDGTRDDAREAL